MPENAHLYLLKIFNVLWERGYVSKEWKKATIIQIPKPNKNHSDPQNYRPISLTSCVCKTYEKIINRRLSEYLENNKKLVRFDTYIRKAFADGRRIVPVFFDLEKAYDMAWRYGIMKDLAGACLKGRLPPFIQDYLRDRSFQVKGFYKLPLCRAVVCVSESLLKLTTRTNFVSIYIKYRNSLFLLKNVSVNRCDF